MRDKGKPPDLSDSDRVALDQLLEDRKWEAENKRREAEAKRIRADKMASFRTWTLWIAAMLGSWMGKDGAAAAWAWLRSLIGRGP